MCVCVYGQIYVHSNKLFGQVTLVGAASLVLLGPCTFRSPESQKESKHCPRLGLLVLLGAGSFGFQECREDQTPPKILGTDFDCAWIQF